MTIKQQYIAELAGRFPNASSHALARIAYKEGMFPTKLAATSAVFRARGGNKAAGCKPYVPQTRFKAGDAFSQIPEGKTHHEKWEPFKIDGPAKALILSDLHIPYHNRRAILATLKYGKDNGANLIVLNGDTADFFSVSFWEKDPRKRRFAEELKTVRDFMGALREHFPRARIVFKVGNHEERWERYMFVKAPELLGVPEFTIPKMLDIRDADFVSDKRPIRLGDLNVLHGHEYKFAISNPVNPARGLFLRAKAYAICAHFHQTSAHSARTVEQESLSTWSTGCLCDLHPDYSPMNDWNHGFAFVEVFESGKFTVQNKFISDGGKVY